MRKVLNFVEILEGIGGFHDTVFAIFASVFGAYALAGYKLKIL